MDPKWQGKVLSVASHYNWSMDYDYYSATVWDAEAGRSTSISIDAADYRAGSDASPEVVEAANAAWVESEVERVLNASASDAQVVVKGKEVVVVKGRKVPIGTKGVAFWVGEGQWGYRVGFNADDGETHWTALSNVEVVNPEQYEISEAQARQEVAARRKPWRVPAAA